MISAITISAFGVSNADIDKQVEKLLSTMTIEEKAGQMTQITLEAMTNGVAGDGVELDSAKLQEVVVKGGVGSILNSSGEAMSIDTWHRILKQIQAAAQRTRLKIPVIYGIDSIHGATYITGATFFPQNISLAATGNAELAGKMAQVTAVETAAAGIPWNFAPVLGVARHPMWPRFYETFGEDTFIASRMGAGYITGYQNAGVPVTACMKHYIGYSYPRSGKDRSPAWIPDRELREIFLPSFAAAVDAGVMTVMVNSSEINGTPVHASSYYLRDILRGELGFTGFVVSDWADIDNLHSREKVVAGRRQAAQIAVNAGIEMSMVPFDMGFTKDLVSLVKSGEVKESVVDDAVRNILRVKYRLGLFDNALPDESLRVKFATPQSTELNRQIARESLVLLENNGVLPIAKDKKIFVTGPTANLMKALNGGWTLTWQGDREELYPKVANSILEAVMAEYGREHVLYAAGSSFDAPVDYADALAKARQSDVVVVCLGEMTYCETPGNIRELSLPRAQLDLVKELKKAGKPVVLILAEGRPRVISEIVPLVDAVIFAGLPGMEGGNAIADIIAGVESPSGKLPFSYPKYASVFEWYDYKASADQEPARVDFQWPFGRGLSYASFDYSNLRLGKTSAPNDDALSLQVLVDVKNTGAVKAKEIIQLYVSDLVASITPANKRLKEFMKIELEPGETKTVEFTLKRDAFSFIDAEGKRIVEDGDFKIAVDSLSASFAVE
jgi:beta-glucosidase